MKRKPLSETSNFNLLKEKKKDSSLSETNHVTSKCQAKLKFFDEMKNVTLKRNVNAKKMIKEW